MIIIPIIIIVIVVYSSTNNAIVVIIIHIVNIISVNIDITNIDTIDTNHIYDSIYICVLLCMYVCIYIYIYIYTHMIYIHIYCNNDCSQGVFSNATCSDRGPVHRLCLVNDTILGVTFGMGWDGTSYTHNYTV